MRLIPTLLLLCLVSFAGMAQSTKNILLKRLTPEGMVYFIKPVTYKGETGKMEVDFTFFQPNDSDTLRLTINTTLSSKTIKGAPETVIIQSTTTLPCDSIQLLFLERNRQSWESRVSSIWYTPATIDALTNNHQLVLTYPSTTITLIATNKARKRLDVALTTIRYELED